MMDVYNYGPSAYGKAYFVSYMLDMDTHLVKELTTKFHLIQ